MAINEDEETFRILAQRAYDQYIGEHAQPFPKGVVASNRGPRRECWTNAWARAKKNPKLRYVEGFAGLGSGDMHRHAFCVGTDGTVVEVTEGYEHAEVYAGVILDLGTVTKIRDEILGEEDWHSSVLQVVLPFADTQRGRAIMSRLVVS